MTVSTRLAHIDFSCGNILIVGDVMLDVFWFGIADRVSPEAPVPVVNVQRQETRLGGAANVAANVASLGGRARLLGVVGDDQAGREMRELLSSKGVDYDLEACGSIPTIVKTRVMAQNQQLLRMDREDADAPKLGNSLTDRYRKSLPNVDVVVLSDYAKGTLSACELLIRLAREDRIPVIVDPKGVDFSRYAGATVITPNFSEFQSVVGTCDSESQVESKGKALLEKLEVEALLITRSEKGMTLMKCGCEPINIPTKASSVYDVTGAGDTVVAALAAAMAVGINLNDAVVMSNAAAGIAVTKPGTTTVEYADFMSSLERGNGSESYWA